MPFLIAILPIFSGVTPKTLYLSLKLLSKFPSFEPISIIKSFFKKLFLSISFLS